MKKVLLIIGIIALIGLAYWGGTFYHPKESKDYKSQFLEEILSQMCYSRDNITINEELIIDTNQLNSKKYIVKEFFVYARVRELDRLLDSNSSFDKDSSREFKNKRIYICANPETLEASIFYNSFIDINTEDFPDENELRKNRVDFSTFRSGDNVLKDNSWKLIFLNSIELYYDSLANLKSNIKDIIYQKPNYPNSLMKMVVPESLKKQYEALQIISLDTVDLEYNLKRGLRKFKVKLLIPIKEGTYKIRFMSRTNALDVLNVEPIISENIKLDQITISKKYLEKYLDELYCTAPAVNGHKGKFILSFFRDNKPNRQ